MAFTPIRIIETENGIYNQLEIQILKENENKYFCSSFDVIGSLHFEKRTNSTYWFGIRYSFNGMSINTVNSFNLILRKLSKHIHNDTQPEQIIKLLNGKRYYLIDGANTNCFIENDAKKHYLLNNQLYAETDKGNYSFNIMNNNIIFGKVIVKDRNDAYRRLDKLLKTARYHNYSFRLGDFEEINF